MWYDIYQLTPDLNIRDIMTEHESPLTTQFGAGEPTPSDITSTLIERHTRYGDFAGHACITQDLKSIMWASPKWNDLSPAQMESLEMIAHKIGRILNGDPDYFDSWHDIEGYARLVSETLENG